MIESLVVALMLWSPARAEEPTADFSDQAIEQKQKDLDSFYEILSRQVQKDFSDEMDFENRLENDRLAFERKLIVERKEFLESLRKVSPARRPQAFSQFWQSQQSRRAEFIKKQDSQRRAFDQQDQRGLRRRQRGVIEDYDNARADLDTGKES